MELPFLPVIIVVLLLVLLVLFLVQRRQRANNEVVPPPDFGQPIDYTNPELKEPETLGDRIRNAPLALKLLLPLALVALLTLGGVLFAVLQPAGPTADTTPQPAAASITEVSATLSNPTRILVQANTNLPDNTSVQGQLLEDGQPFAWSTAESAVGSAFDGKVQVNLSKAPDAPTPTQGKKYTIVLSATGTDGNAVTTEPTDLTIPQLYANDFYAATASGATTVPTSTVAPTTAATAAPEPTSAPTPAPTATVVLTATVANGGNLRAEPNLNGEVLDQNDAFDVVTLLEKTADGRWYRLTNPRNKTGWFSASLLSIDESTVAQVPVQGSVPAAPPAASETTPQATATGGLTATVANGGNLRAEPNINGAVLDQNNARESVQLLAKTADGKWFKVTNTRGKTGWFSASLLTIDDDVAAQVPEGS